MTRWRRAEPGLALILLTLGGGCHRLPFHRVDPALDPRALGRHGAAAPATLLADAAERPRDSVPLPPLPLRPVSDREAFGEPAPTPLLDAALARAQAMQDAAVEPTSTGPVIALPEPPTFEATGEAPRAEMPAPLALESAPPALADGPANEDMPSSDRPEARVPAEEDRGISAAELASPPRSVATAPVAEDERPPAPEREAEDATARPAPPPDDASAPQPAEPGPNGSELAIVDLRLCRRVLGFGQVEGLDPSACRPGQTLIVYCEMAGLRYVPDGGDGVRSELEGRLELLGGAGDSPIWSKRLGTAEDRCPRARRDYYVSYRLTLPGPAIAPPGTYRLRLSERDRFADRETSRTVSIRIVPESP